MGDHHFTLQVLSDPGWSSRGCRRLRHARTINVALARALLADTGMTVAREDLALEAAFWAQLPANFAIGRARRRSPRAISPRMAPLSQLPVRAGDRQSLGRCARAPDDELALAVLLLAARERSQRSRRRQPQGHRTHVRLRAHGLRQNRVRRLSCSHARPPGVTQVVFDKDRGLEILVRALGGDYLPLKNGMPTGFNPLQLAADARECRVLEDLAAKSRPGRRAFDRARGGGPGSCAARHARARARPRGGSRG